jgi:hypothetical protein
MKVIGWLLVIGVLVGGGFAAVQAGFKWWDLSQAIDEAVYGAPSGSGGGAGWPSGPREGRVDRVRSAIVRGAARAGFALQEHRIWVSEDGSNLRVSVRWAAPVLTMDEEVVLAIPLSIERTYTPRRF